MENFFGKQKELTVNIQEAVNEASRRVRSNIKWFNTNNEIILKWLTDFSYKLKILALFGNNVFDDNDLNDFINLITILN